MSCTKCGREIPGSLGLCASCHLAVGEKLLNSQLEGVSGWLLFFCISLVFFIPFIWFIHISARVSSLGLYDFFDLTRVVFGFVAGIALWMERPAALILLKAYFAIVIMVMIGTVIRVFAADTPIEIVPAKHRSWFVQTMVYLVVWVSYFHKSQRVKCTFGRNL